MKNVTRVSKAAALRTIKDGKRDRLIPDNIHIIMSESAAKKWLRDLRSGTFIQDEGSLHCPSTGGFCCLGVQQYGALKGQVEVDDHDNYETLPTVEYLTGQGIAFLNQIGFTSNNPWVPKADNVIAELNDKVNYLQSGKGKHHNDFTKMANYIESTLAVYPG